MKNKIATLLTALLLVSALGKLSAQKQVGGEWSAGPRLGGAAGLSLKHHAGSNKSAIEILTAFKNFDKNEDIDGFTLSALYEKLAPFTENGQFSALFGGGINMNFKNKFKFGLSGILGFDWRLKKNPLTLQVDWMPTWFFVNASYFSGINGAFTIRYVLNRKKFEKK